VVFAARKIVVNLFGNIRFGTGYLKNAVLQIMRLCNFESRLFVDEVIEHV